MAQEKLLLKKTLFDELKSTTNEIEKLEDFKKNEHAYVPSIDAKLTCLNQHKEFVQKCIQICVVRNKF